MKKVLFLLLAYVLFVFMTPKRNCVLWLAGDSTMANKPLCKNITDTAAGKIECEPFPERGWGQLLPALVKEGTQIHNMARNGRSTRTFISEGLWKSIMDSIEAGDYVVIQFGHNDESKEKGDRYTPPDAYKTNLIAFISEARAKGAVPILCTPVVRRRFDKDGKFYDVHGEYPDIVRKTAQEEKCILADMHLLSWREVESLGEEESKKIFLHLPAGANRNFPNGVSDNTHFNEEGALLMAKLFAEAIKSNNNEFINLKECMR